MQEQEDYEDEHMLDDFRTSEGYLLDFIDTTFMIGLAGTLIVWVLTLCRDLQLNDYDPVQWVVWILNNIVII